MVKATLNLFKTAFENKENEHFVLLSDKCIPLYNAKHAPQLENEPKNHWHHIRYKAVAKKEFFDENNFYGQSYDIEKRYS